MSGQEAEGRQQAAAAGTHLAAMGRGQLEDALRHAHKAGAVGQLTSGLAHDFNNHLAAIAGSVERIGTYAAQGRTAKVGHHAGLALASIRRAAALTHRLLAFTRHQAMEPRLVDVNALVSGMEDLIRCTVGPGVDVTLRLHHEPCPAFCDANQLEGALLNLVINARDALAGSGSVVVGTTCDDVLIRSGALGAAHPHQGRRAGAEGGHTALFVTDSGAGMGADVLVRAFDPFFTTKPLGQGTGLGLFMVHDFVCQANGCVRLRSAQGQGTTMTLCLPQNDVRPGEAP